MSKNSDPIIYKNIRENRYIIPVTLIVSTSLVVIVVAIAWSISCIMKENLRSNIRLDKFTYCLQTVMEQSSKSGKAIDAQAAKEICKDVETK